MNRFILRLLLLGFAISPIRASAEEVLHWYQFTVQAGDRCENFTGASPHDSDRMENLVITGAEMITLERLRDFGIYDPNKGATWRENTQAKFMKISPRAVVYFTVLAGDPLAGTAQRGKAPEPK